jgi:hypothetical protein
MQHQTRRITDWYPTRGASISGPERPATPMEAPWKQLVYRKNGESLSRPEFHKEPEEGVEYYGRPYSLNTKYIVDIEDHPVIGCIVTMASGKTVWIDETVAGLTILCNRR